MRRILYIAPLVLSLSVFAQERRAARDTDLGKKETSVAPDRSLAGDLTRKKELSGEAAPALQYDQFRKSVELQVASKRRSQIEDLKKIIELTQSGDSKERKEMPTLLFRLGELYWEESKFFFFEANRKDDDLLQAMNRKDKAAQDQAKREKQELLNESKAYGRLAMDQYSEIVANYKDFPRTDEVLYFLGHNLMELGEERKSLAAFKRLIDKYPKSKFIPDAYLAFGEHYFNGSKGKKEMLEKALAAYKKAAAFPENQVYGFALYKQGWCYFNLADYQRAMDMFKAVVLYGEIAGVAEVEGTAGNKRGGGRAGLVREARNDFVRSYARGGGSPSEARAAFGALAKQPDDRFKMMKQLATLYYEDGKDREAAVSFKMLINERPLSPEAPGFQGKIVDCVLRAGRKKTTVDQVRLLVKIMTDVNRPEILKTEKDKKALEEAQELAERTISNLAVNWHNEGKKTRDEETFGFAHEVYGDYLTLFPESPKAYDLRFFWAELLNDNLQRYDKAAEEYTRVFLTDISRLEKAKKDGKRVKPGKWMVNAGYNAVLAYDEVVKRATESGKLKPSAGGDVKKKLPIPAEKKALLEACERYVKHLPNGDKRVEIAFKAAKIYYDHNYLDEAVAQFSEIALKYPTYKFENGDRAGEIAANLVLDSYNLQQDWSKVNEWARRFYANEALAKGKFRDELAAVIEQSAFKIVNQLEAQKEYAKAAEAYLNFVSEFPTSSIADKALYNASIDFFNAHQLNRAIEVRKRIIEQYPKSQFVPQTMYALAEGYEAIGDFESAADYYESYARAFERSGRGDDEGKRARKRRGRSTKGEQPSEERAGAGQAWEESKAQIALFNAGVFRDGLGQYKAALKNRERYLELWPDNKDAEAVFLSIVDLHEKNGSYARALKQLEAYEKRYFKEPSKVLMAQGRMAKIYEEKQNATRPARRVHERVMAYYEKLPSRLKKSLDIAALDAVARAHFVLADEQFRRYTGLRLRWSRLQNVGEFKNSVKDKAQALEGIQKLYTQTVGFKSADPAICALGRIGDAYDHFVQRLLDPPLPRGMPEELVTEFKLELERQAEPVKAKAAEAFAAAVAKSQEFDIFNDCSRVALEKLRETYRPEQFPKMAEDLPPLKSIIKEQAVGSPVLAAIQPIPVMSKARAQELQSRPPPTGPTGRSVAEGKGPQERQLSMEDDGRPDQEPSNEEPGDDEDAL